MFISSSTGQVPVTVNGSIPILSGSGCNQSDIITRFTDADLCPLVGERVVISCFSSEGYTINGPNRSSTDAPLVIPSFSSSDSGRYTCRSHNTGCGAAVSSIFVSESGRSAKIKLFPLIIAIRFSSFDHN